MKSKILIGVLLLIITAGIYVKVQDIDLTEFFTRESYSEDGVPGVVLQKYQDMESKYGGSLGARLNKCELGKNTIYVVVGSGGFTGHSYYYTERGRLIGSQYASDIVGESEEAPMDISDYDCSPLKQSKGK